MWDTLCIQCNHQDGSLLCPSMQRNPHSRHSSCKLTMMLLASHFMLDRWMNTSNVEEFPGSKIHFRWPNSGTNWNSQVLSKYIHLLLQVTRCLSALPNLTIKHSGRNVSTWSMNCFSVPSLDVWNNLANSLLIISTAGASCVTTWIMAKIRTCCLEEVPRIECAFDDH